MPKEDTEGIRTRSQQRQQAMDQRRFSESSDWTLDGQQTTDSVLTASTTGATPAPAMLDLSVLLTALQEQTNQLKNMQEQARQMKEELQRGQEEQARQMKEELQRGQEEQASQLKELHATIGSDLKVIKEQVEYHEEQVQRHENRISKAEVKITDVEKALVKLISETGNATPVIATPAVHGFKVPPFDGTSSWSAYKIQFEAVVRMNGWTKAQAMTALTLALRDQALTILEALSKDVTYDQLVEALESRYGDKHLEHVYRAQLKDRAQRSAETLQCWALEVEKLD
ncbi:uncharacterized protein LOC111628383 [Centruroides sculpturatus]|uniref:uncharacterized protein LOC111628383 n=2 Tax=Centruroides sculpturatus TaxID=218467 RepID=UPI000C6E2983|nr:uncharacterized protein LOC111628383 [Centruroides sculpturatus]